jgi:Glutamate synthase central domain
LHATTTAFAAADLRYYCYQPLLLLDIVRAHVNNKQVTQQAAFGWSSEDVDMQIADMAGTGKETTFSMGDDIPLAVLSQRPHVLYDYFKQRFAQVSCSFYTILKMAALLEQQREWSALVALYSLSNSSCDSKSSISIS